MLTSLGLALADRHVLASKRGIEDEEAAVWAAVGALRVELPPPPRAQLSELPALLRDPKVAVQLLVTMVRCPPRMRCSCLVPPS